MYALPTQRRRHRAAPETTPLWRLFLINLSFSLSPLTEPLQRLCWCCGGGKWAREQAFHLVSTLLCAGMLWQRSIIQSIEHMCRAAVQPRRHSCPQNVTRKESGWAAIVCARLCINCLQMFTKYSLGPLKCAACEATWCWRGDDVPTLVSAAV